jgi:hypothetical protein
MTAATPPVAPPVIPPAMSVWARRRLHLRETAREYGLLTWRFMDRYGLALLALISSALIAWYTANSVSDYTKGGWEVHFEQRALGVNIHFHHWYYGIPLGLLALLLIERNTTISIFLFGLGASLSTHSYINEGGIPSFIEGGQTLRVPTEIYLPAITLFAAMFAVYVIRREEWLVRARERDELAMSYFVHKDQVAKCLSALNAWAAKHFIRRRYHRDRWTSIEYVYWRATDKALRGEWQFHYTLSPFDDKFNVLVIKLQHIPLSGRKGVLDEWLEEIHDLLKPHAHLALVNDKVFDESNPEPASQNADAQPESPTSEPAL